jgi:hypothetical protein
MRDCFVIMPIATPTGLVSDYGGDARHFEHILDYLFSPALSQAEYNIIPPSVLNSQIIQAEIIKNLETADLVLCDISRWNANVFFELGIRVALDRPVALVKDDKTRTIPFDNAIVSCHTYDSKMTPWSIGPEIESLVTFIRSAGEQDRNALWKYFGITQRASVPAEGNPAQEQLNLILNLLQRPTPPMQTTTSTLPSPRLGDGVSWQLYKAAAARDPGLMDLDRQFGRLAADQNDLRSDLDCL